MPSPGYRKKLLTQTTINPLSIDGYNASLLNKKLKLLQKQGKEYMVIIGHPKALSPYSLKCLDEFLSKNVSKHTFTTYSYLHQTIE